MNRILAALLATLLLLGTARGAEPGAPGAEFRRGVGVHSLMNWGSLASRTAPATFRRYADQPFGPDHDLPEALLRAVADAGFDFVRLTVDPGPFLQLEGARREALEARLLATVRRFHALGLAVLVDLHPNEQVPAYEGERLVAAADTPLFKAYTGLVARIAHLLAGLHSPAVALEPLNEPPYGYDAASTRRWQAMAETLHAAARAEAPGLLLVLSGAQSSDRRGLVALDPAPFRGSRVLYTFHYYEPFAFTHQGVPSGEGRDRARRYLSGLPYPSDSLPAELVLETLRANVIADPALDGSLRRRMLDDVRAKLAAYRAAGASRARIASDFAQVSDWAKRGGIPPGQIILGEFGVARAANGATGADALSAEAWLYDVRAEAEACGFAWAIWELSGPGGMQIVSARDATQLDPRILASLGLTP